MKNSIIVKMIRKYAKLMKLPSVRLAKEVYFNSTPEVQAEYLSEMQARFDAEKSVKSKIVTK